MYSHTLDTLVPLSRPAARRALKTALAADPELTHIRFDALAQLQHRFCKGRNERRWSPLSYESPAESFTPTLRSAAAAEKLIVVEDNHPIPSTIGQGSALVVRLAPAHQIDMLMKSKLVRCWDDETPVLMEQRGPLLAPLLAEQAAQALALDPSEAFYATLRSSSPEGYPGEASVLAAKLALMAKRHPAEATPLLRMLAMLSPFNGSTFELLRTARAVLA